MAMTILNNAAVQMTLGELNKNITQVGKDLKKITRGEKVTGASDDASSYAISEKMRVRLRALDQDKQNVQNGSKLLNVAENGIQHQIDILRTLKEKVIDACNDTNTEEDRKTIQKEMNQFLDQIEQVAHYTEYNTQKILIGNTWLDDSKSVYEVLGTPTLVSGSDDLDIIPDIYPVLDGYTGPFDIFEEFDQYIQELPGIIEDYNPEKANSTFSVADYYDPTYVYGDHALSFYSHLYGGKDGAPVAITQTENFTNLAYENLFPNITDSMTADEIRNELNEKTVNIGGRDYVFTTDAWKDYRNDATGQFLPHINLTNITSRARLLGTVLSLSGMPDVSQVTSGSATRTSTQYYYPDESDFDNTVTPPTLSADYLSTLDSIAADYSSSGTLASSGFLEESEAKGTESHEVKHYHVDEQIIHIPAQPEYTIDHPEQVKLVSEAVLELTPAGTTVKSASYDDAGINGQFSGGRDGHGRTHGNFVDPDSALKQPEKAKLDFSDVTLSDNSTFVLNGSKRAVYTFVNDSSGLTYQGKHTGTDGRTSTDYYTIGLQSDIRNLDLGADVTLTKTDKGNGKYDLHFEAVGYGEYGNSYNIKSYPDGRYDWSETVTAYNITTVKAEYETIPAWTETVPATEAKDITIPARDWDISTDYYACNPYEDIGGFNYSVSGATSVNTLGAQADTKATYVINVSDVTNETAMDTFFRGIAGKGFSYCDAQPIEFINTADPRSMAAFRKMDVYDAVVDSSQKELMDIGGQRVVDLADVKTQTLANVEGGMNFSEAFSKAFADAIMDASGSNSAGVNDTRLSYLYQEVDADGNALTQTDSYGRTNQPKYTVDATNNAGIANKIIGVKITSAQSGSAGNEEPVVGWEGTLRHYDIDFGKYFSSHRNMEIPDDLYGKGFRVYCATDHEHWFNFIFSNGIDPGRPEGSEDVKDILIDVSNVQSASDLVNAIFDYATPVLTGDDPTYNHMMRVAANSYEGILTVYDFRRWSIDDLEEYPNRQEKGAKIADGIVDDVIKTAGYEDSTASDIFVRDLIIHHTDHDSMNIHLKIPDMRLKYLFNNMPDGRNIRDYSLNSANDRKLLLGKKNPPGGIIDKAIEYAVKANVMVGAQNARLAATFDNVVVQHETTTLSESTIRDADVAQAMTQYTKNNILAQASQTMLAQANQGLSSVLSLLQ